MFRTKPKGFTLIELLVVVAIIVVLISILMPSLSRARERAKDVLCASNMAQINLALNMYMDEYRSTPYMTSGDGVHASSGFGALINVPSASDPVTATPAAIGWRPTLIPTFCSSQKVFFCPILTERYPNTSNPNDMTGGGNQGAYILSLVAVPRSRIDSMDVESVLAPWEKSGFHDPYMRRSSIPLVLEWSSVHKNATGTDGYVRVLFADGSVRLVNNMLKSTAPCQWETAPKYGILPYFRD